MENNEEKLQKYIKYGLSHEEMLTSPRELFLEESGAQFEIEESSLLNDLYCPICREIMENTMVVMECLHRFI